MRRRRAGDARQRQRRREHVLAEAGVRILRIERIDQQRGVLRTSRPARIGPSAGAIDHVRGYGQLASQLSHGWSPRADLACWSASIAPKRRSRRRIPASAASNARSSKSGHRQSMKCSSAYAHSQSRKSLRRFSPAGADQQIDFGCRHGRVDRLPQAARRSAIGRLRLRRRSRRHASTRLCCAE